MTITEIIAACSQNTELPFLVIGGFAVIAHGYPRDTVDLDFVVRRSDRDAWTRRLEQYGYNCTHEHENFAQFTAAEGGMDVDLMFVNDQTFDQLFASSVSKEIGPVSARFPSLEHLVALKLHVIKQNLPHRVLGDLDDVINVLLANRVNVREEKWRQLFAKYGNLELYEKVARALSA